MSSWTIVNRETARDGRTHRHEINTGTDRHVLVQVYGADGALIPFPGAGPAIRQLPPRVLVPCLHETYYPLTVVTSP